MKTDHQIINKECSEDVHGNKRWQLVNLQSKAQECTGALMPRWARGLQATGQHWVWVSCVPLQMCFLAFRSSTMATTLKKSHCGPVYRCEKCPWEGDKKGSPSPLWPITVTSKRPPTTVKSALPSSWPQSPGGDIAPPLDTGSMQWCMWRVVDGVADARPISKSYSDRFWGLFNQAGQVPEAMEEDTETGGDVDEAKPLSADVEHEDSQAPASLEPVRECEMEVSVEGAPDRPEPGVQSSNRATAAGACTPCSIILEDVLDLGLSPLGSFSSE